METLIYIPEDIVAHIISYLPLLETYDVCRNMRFLEKKRCIDAQYTHPISMNKYRAAYILYRLCRSDILRDIYSISSQPERCRYIELISQSRYGGTIGPVFIDVYKDTCKGYNDNFSIRCLLGKRAVEENRRDIVEIVIEDLHIHEDIILIDTVDVDNDTRRWLSGKHDKQICIQRHLCVCITIVGMLFIIIPVILWISSLFKLI